MDAPARAALPAVFVRPVAAVALGVMVASVVTATPGWAAPSVLDRAAQTYSSTDVEAVEAEALAFTDEAPNWNADTTEAAVLDAADVSVLASEPAVDIPNLGAGDAGGGVSLLEPSEVEGAVPGLDSNSLVFTVEVPAEANRVTIEAAYDADAVAVGGGWAERLSLVIVPDCALHEEASNEAASDRGLGPDCALIEIPGSVNDTRTQTLRAEIDADLLSTTADSVTIAAVPAASGGGGDWTATDLSPAGSWTGGSGAGSFDYGYPISLPPAEGPVPQVGLGYSSASHDGATSGTNNQASWIGDGWDYSPGFIERSYIPCGDDAEGANNAEWPSGDLCWEGASESVTLSLDGVNASLIKDGSTGTWTMTADAGWKVELLGTAATGTAATSEHWKVTTTDGTQYFFAGRAADAKSRWTIPVYGNHSGERCYKAGDFQGSGCAQAYRWMLDRIVDTSGNETHLTYATETGTYAAGFDPETLTSYIRSGHLTRIDYGIRDGSATGRVDFTLSDRCLSDCRDGSGDPKPGSWPDTPWDLACTETPCMGFAPVFFSSKRLTGISTKVADGTGWTEVDSWALVHEFKDYGDQSQVVLWLASIQQTGRVGGTETLPVIEFGAQFHPNRVETGNGRPGIWRPRLTSILSETGAVTTITYSERDCGAGNLPASEHNNTRRCFPVWYTPETLEEPEKEYFHKYVVDAIAESPNTGAGETVWTAYEYANTGGGTSVLWAWDDSEFNDKAYRTYNQWRGYSQVTAYIGDPASPEPRLRTSTRFLRGMDGQPLPDGTKRSVVVTDSQGKTHLDHEALAGQTLESLTYDGGTIIGSTVVEYWTKQTASRTHDGGTLKAWKTAPAVERTRTKLSAAAWQTVETRTIYDAQGRPTSIAELGDIAATGDETCTRVWYAENTALHLTGLPRRTETVAVDCDATPSRPADVIADERYFYDGAASDTAAPTRGLLTRVEALDEWAGGPVYATVTEYTHDALGRVVTESDALGATTETVYTPQTGPVTKVVTINALGHEVTADLQPAWGEPVKLTDANGNFTEIGYSPLGYRTGVWLPGRKKATEKASFVYTYAISQTVPTTVTSEAITANGTYLKTIEIFDGLLRKRQTQTDTYGGRLVSQTVFDSRGLVAYESGANFNNESAATGDLVYISETNDVARTVFTYDGAGRVTEAAFKVKGDQRWSTATVYGGNDSHWQTATVPPSGDTPTAVLADARGQVVELRQFHGSTASGAYDSTSYGYTPGGAIASVTDPGGNEWSYRYDLRGRLASFDDPDTGTTGLTYDAVGNVIATVDEADVERGFAYDALGRQTQVTDAAGDVELSFTYDGAFGGIGLPYKSTRHLDGQEWTTETRRYNHAGQPVQQVWTLPAAAGDLAGTYGRSFTYKVDGSVATEAWPAVGGLGRETVRYTYDQFGALSRIHSDIAGQIHVYMDEATYSPYGKLLQRRLGDPSLDSRVDGQAWQTWIYEEGTGRLAEYYLDKDSYGSDPTSTLAALTYAYDPAGNITSITDANDHVQFEPETQCFEYDYLKRLTEAWTQSGTGACADSVATADIGGIGSYGQAFTYDVVGNRTSVTEWTDAGTVTDTYGYDPDSAHLLEEVVTTAATGHLVFEYDQTGNTTSIDRDGEIQILEWDARDRIASVSEGDDTTAFVDTAGGERLFRADPDGAVTAYLAGMEIRAENGSVSGTRYYRHAGETIAARADKGDLHWIGSDHHGTGSWSVNAYTLTAQVRRYDPFGQARDNAPGWPGEVGFVGGTENESVGFTTIGAREYLAETGRFLTRDRVADIADPQQMHGYAYAMNNPVLYSDSTGLWPSFDDLKSAVSNGIEKVVDTAKTAAVATTVAASEAWDATTNWVKENRYEIEGFAIAAAIDILCTALTAGVGALACFAASGAIGSAWVAWRSGASAEEIAYAALAGALAGLVGFGIGKAVERIFMKYLSPAKLKKLFGNSADEAPSSTPSKTDDPPSKNNNGNKKSCNSFIPGTQVVMADGSSQSIEDVKVGDEVLATDMVTGETDAAEVSGIKATPETERELVTITLSDKASNAPPAGRQAESEAQEQEFEDSTTITATAGHAYWAAPAGTEPWAGDPARWTPARDLTIGTWLHTSNGTWTQITAVTHHTDKTSTRNLTIANTHTYYVTNSHTDTLVHNCGLTGSLKQLLKSWKPKVFTVGGNKFLFPKRGMKHILERHHPKYWNGSTKSVQTFLPRSWGTSDIERAVAAVLNQNRSRLSNGAPRYGQIQGSYGGYRFTLGFKNHHIYQFYPH